MKYSDKAKLVWLDDHPESFGRTFGGQWIVWNDEMPNRSQAGRFSTISEAIEFHMDRNTD